MPSAEVYVEEHYTYQLSLGLLPTMSLKKQEGSIQVIVPCDGKLKYTDRQFLRDISLDESEVALGNISITLPDLPYPVVNLDMRIPATLQGQSLTDWMRSGKNLEWKTNYAVQQPPQSLLSITGEITDDINGDRHFQRVESMLSGSPENFANDLCLQLKIWVSDFISGSRWLKQKNYLQDLLLQAENANTVRLPHINDLNELQRRLIELANSGGGLLLIGIDKQGQIVGPTEHERSTYIEHISTALLQAALTCEPTIPFTSEPIIFTSFNGRLVAKVDVPEIKGTIQFKKKTIVWGNVQNSVPQTSINSRFEVQNYHSTFDDINQFINTLPRESFVSIDASTATIEQIGQIISGLVNAQSNTDIAQPEGQIIFFNLPESFVQDDSTADNQNRRGWLSNLNSSGNSSNPGNTPRTTFHHRLNTALNRCIPIPEKVTLEIVTMRKAPELVGVLRLHQMMSPVLYEDKGFEWKSNRLFPLNSTDVIERYVISLRINKNLVNLRKGGQVTYGELTVPVAPPSGIPDHVRRNKRIDPPSLPNQAYYDTQNHAMVWKSVELHNDRDTNGWQCVLFAPLRYALMDPNDLSSQQDGMPQNSKKHLTGSFSLRLDGVLVSNAQTEIIEAPGTLLLRHPSVMKTTYVHVTFTADPQYLFKHRRQSSILRFQLPNIRFGDGNTAAQLQILTSIHKMVWQICSDLGFRIPESQRDPQATSFFLSGWRSKDFHDIELMARISWKDTRVDRELRYSQRTDTKATTVATLDILVLLQGAGNNVAHELATLHTHIHQLVNTRLQFLSTE